MANASTSDLIVAAASQEGTSKCKGSDYTKSRERVGPIHRETPARAALSSPHASKQHGVLADSAKDSHPPDRR